MFSTKEVFRAIDRKFYPGTPYFSEKLLISIHDRTLEVNLIVNNESGYINLSRFYNDLQRNIEKDESKLSSISRWKYTQSMIKYVDAYSLSIYGHLHYSFRGNHIYDTEDEITQTSNWKTLKIKPILVTKGITQTSIIEEAPEIFGEKYNGYPNELKGLYGDFHLITEIMESISISFKIYNNECLAFMISHLSNRNKTFTDVLTSPFNELRDIPLREIQNDKSTYKGKRAERLVMELLSKYILDIEDCSTKPGKMDLYSPSLKIRFEVKCWSSTEKITSNLNRFHLDCIRNIDNTNIFIYLDLSKRCPIKYHFEINPLRIYIDSDSFDEKFIEFLIESAKEFNSNRIAENGKQLTSNIIRMDLRESIREVMKDELKGMGRDMISIIENSNSKFISSTLPTTAVDRDVLEFVEKHREFKTGYLMRESYPNYIEWAKSNNKLLFSKSNLYRELRKICDEKRPHGIHIWVSK